jgi:uncharacterized membrane protein
MAEKEPGFWETIIRIVHISVGVAALDIAAWFLIWVSPFNSYSFGIFLIFATVLLLIGICGNRKEVFKAFFLPGV